MDLDSPAAAISDLMASRRRREPELMDRPDLHPREHVRALRGLARINALSRAGATLWRRIAPLAPGRPLRVLDLACGGGDVAIELWRRARASGTSLTVHGLDVSPRAVRCARRRARARGADVSFAVADVLEDPLPAGWDVVTCSLFVHHLDEPGAVRLLARMGAAAARRVVVLDLRRGPWGSALAATVPRLVTRSSVVHVDARRSARAAFTLAELAALAERAGLGGARVQRCWPARLVLTWQPGVEV